MSKDTDQNLALSEKSTSVLKTKEAKASIIYKLAKQAIEKAHKEKGLEQKLIQIDLPSTLNDGANSAVALAFSKEDFITGFSIAESYGIIDPLILQIEQLPLKALHNYNEYQETTSKQERKIAEFLAIVKTLPGYKKPEYLISSSTNAMKINWAKKLNMQLVNNVLIPKKEYLRAAQQCIKLGYNRDAIRIAEEHLEPEQIADLCEISQTDFNVGIMIARDKKLPDLEARLKESHIQSIKQGTNTGLGNKSLRYDYALSLAKDYGFKEDKIQEILKEGVQSLMFEFSNDLTKWKNKYDNISMERLRGISNPWRNASNLYDEERRLEFERVRFVYQPSDTAKGLISLITKLPKEETEQKKKEIYDLCNHFSSFDGFGIAMAFDDVQQVFYYGLPILENLSYRQAHQDIINKVTAAFEIKILPRITVDQRKKFIRTVINLKSFRDKDDYSITVARNYGLQEWLMQELETNQKHLVAAKIALDMDKKDKAKELYLKANQIEKAIDLTDNDLEKASFYLLMAEEQIKHRIRHSFIIYSHAKNEFNKEIELMGKAIDLAKTSFSIDKPFLMYRESRRKVVDELFSNGNYVEGCLFIKEAKIPKDELISLITPTIIEDAEKKEDFAGCYLLSKLRERKDDANNYKILAQQFNQKILLSLNDLIYVEKPVSPQKITDSSPVDDMPF